MFASSSTSPGASSAGPAVSPAAAPVGRPAVRSAAAVNSEIRALWARVGGGVLSPSEQERYQRLLVEWAAAVRADVVEAA